MEWTKQENDLVEGAMMTCYNEPGKFDCNVYKKARANARALVAAQAEVVNNDREVSENGSDNGEDSEHDDFCPLVHPLGWGLYNFVYYSYGRTRIISS